MVFPHQEVDLSAHFRVIDSPACFVGLPLLLLARLLIIPLALNVVDNSIHSEDSDEDAVGQLHISAWDHHGLGEELGVVHHLHPTDLRWGQEAPLTAAWGFSVI